MKIGWYIGKIGVKKNEVVVSYSMQKPVDSITSTCIIDYSVSQTTSIKFIVDKQVKLDTSFKV